MRGRAAAALVPLLILVVGCSQIAEQRPDAAPTTPATISPATPSAAPTASSTLSGTAGPPLSSVADFYASGAAGPSGPPGTDGSPLLDETRTGPATYALPDAQRYTALTVAFTCDAHVAVSVRIGEADQPGGYDTSSTDCAGAIGAYTTPVLDLGHLPRSVSVSAPAGVQVSMALYGVTAEELAS